MVEFSVIIPTYKRPELLQRCLEALSPARQRFYRDRYEVIVCDDEPAEQTREVVVRSPAPAVCVVGRCKGPAASRNYGASVAKGRWLVFTDDDCIPSPGWLTAFFGAIQPDCLVYEGKTTCLEGLRSPMQYAPVNETGGVLWSCNFMVASSLFRSLGGFHEGFPTAAMEDVDFRERLKDRNVSWKYVPEAGVDHPPKTLQLRSLLDGHKSYYYFSIVRRGTTPRLWPMLLRIAQTRLKAFIRTGLCADCPKTASLVFAELFAVGIYHHQWCTKFLRSARGVK